MYEIQTNFLQVAGGSRVNSCKTKAQQQLEFHYKPIARVIFFISDSHLGLFKLWWSLNFEIHCEELVFIFDKASCSPDIPANRYRYKSSIVAYFNTNCMQSFRIESY